MLDQAFAALTSFEWGDDPAVLKPIDEAVIATHGQTAARAELEGQLLAALATANSRAAKDYLFRHLMIVGTNTSVPALAKFLTGELSHLARYALERIPTAEAAQALRDACGQANNAYRIGAMSSLGVRRDAASVPLLTDALMDQDPAVARAAAYALGDIRTVDAAKALSHAQPAEQTNAAVADASLSCAEGLLAAGNKAGALAIFKRYIGENQAKHVRVAATRGMLACAK